MLESTLADLTANCRRTTGDVPPPLVGATTTVIGSKVYVFGGRLVPKRVLVSDLYALDLETLVWTKLWPPPGHGDGGPRSKHAPPGEVVEELDKAFEGPSLPTASKGPAPRYFHSADAFGHRLFFFGGMGYQAVPSRSQSPTGSVSSRTSRGSNRSKASRTSKSSKNSKREQDEEGDNYPQFCVLADLFVWDTMTNSWSFPTPPVVPPSSATASPNSSPKSVSVTPEPNARYAHLSCITNNCLVIIGGQDLANKASSPYIQEVCVLDLDRMVWIAARPFDSNAGTYRSIAVSRPVTVHPASEGATTKRRSVRTSIESADAKSPKSESNGLLHLSYSSPPAKDAPEPIWLFSNFSFGNVKRSIDMVSAPRHPNFACPVTHLTHLMSAGPSLPPGLRFPTGAVIGHHLIVCGISLSQPNSAFAIWALDLSQAPKGGKLSWQKLDPGSIMSHNASWSKAVAWRNTMVILGDRDRDISQDYDHRQLNWNHVAFIDLEAFGIYQPPLQLLPPSIQQAGLDWLEMKAAHDFEIIAADGTTITCNKRILQERWPWFRDELQAFRTKAAKAVADLKAAESEDPVANGSLPPLEVKLPRTLDLPETPEVVLAVLQYFYTLNLCTSLQLRTNVLIPLLFFARKYDVPNLRGLVCHALHAQIHSASIAAAIYEASTLAGAAALQVRSLKKMMISSTQQKLPRQQ